MIDQEKRQVFIEYLTKLIEGDEYSEDWQKYIIEHYQDEELEKVRRSIVRLRIEAGDPKFFPVNKKQREQLQILIKELQ